MTGAQESYLKTLAEQAHKPDPTNKEMTKAEASELIDQLREEAGLENSCPSSSGPWNESTELKLKPKTDRISH
jgi:DUF3072 family protein